MEEEDLSSLLRPKFINPNAAIGRINVTSSWENVRRIRKVALLFYRKLWEKSGERRRYDSFLSSLSNRSIIRLIRHERCHGCRSSSNAQGEERRWSVRREIWTKHSYSLRLYRKATGKIMKERNGCQNIGQSSRD